MAVLAGNSYDKHPKPAHEAAKILKETRFDDALSVRKFCWEINCAPGLSDLPLGHYYVGSGIITKTYCYLRFRDGMLPRDPPREGPLGEPNITWLKRNSNAKPELPTSIHQIGQLCFSPTTDAKKAKPSSFIIAVTPISREVYVIWNPNGSDLELTEELESDDDDTESQAYKAHREKIATRPTSGTFPGFPNPCTAFRLFQTVGDLCQRCDPGRQLNISGSDFITLPPKVTLEFPSYPPPAWHSLRKGRAK